MSPGLHQRHERFEVLPVHLTAAVFEVPDDRGEAAREGHGDPERLALAREHAELAVDFRLALAHREVTPDARLRLRVGAIVGGDCAHGALTCRPVSGERGAIPCGIELIEGLHAHPRLVGDGQPFPHDAHEDALHAIAPLHHLVDMGVNDGRAEEQRTVDQLPPLVAPDIVGDRRLHEGAEETGQLAHARRDATVELTQHEGAVAAVPDAARSDPVRRPVDETAHRALGPNSLRDQLLAEPILQRHDNAGGGESRRDLRESLPGVVTLDGEEDEGQAVAEIGWKYRTHAGGGGFAATLDGEPMGVDGLDVLRMAVDEEHVVSGAREGGAGGASDRASAVDGHLHGAPQVSQAPRPVNARGAR